MTHLTKVISGNFRHPTAYSAIHNAMQFWVYTEKNQSGIENMVWETIHVGNNENINYLVNERRRCSKRKWGLERSRRTEKNDEMLRVK